MLTEGLIRGGLHLDFFSVVLMGLEEAEPEAAVELTAVWVAGHPSQPGSRAWLFLLPHILMLARKQCLLVLISCHFSQLTLRSFQYNYN